MDLKLTILIIVTFIVTFMSIKGWSHPHNSPVRAQLLMEDNDRSSNNLGGYGYIASSEAEAASSFEFGCSTQEINSYYRCGSGGAIHPRGDERDIIIRSIQDVFRPVILQRLREEMAEKLIFEHAALTSATTEGSRPNWPTALPSCLEAASDRTGRLATTDARRSELATLHRSLPTGMTPLATIAALPANQRLRVNKFNAVINANSSGNLIRAMMLNDQLKKRKDYFCARSTYSGTVCTDLGNQIARIKSSYPSLYGTTANPVPTDHLNNMHNAIYDVMGASSSSRLAGRRIRGHLLYGIHSHIPSINFSADEYKDFEAAVSSRIEAAHNASAVAATNRTTPQMNQVLALDSLNQSISDLQTTWRNSMQAKMDAICSPSPGMQLADFVNGNPNVVRQLMADAGPADKDALRMVLCAENMRENLAPRPQCQGVTSSTNATGDVVRVNRTSSSWPFENNNKYTLTYPTSPAGSPPTLRTEINFPISIRPRRVAQAFLDNFKTNVQGFYNCSAGNRPPDTFGPVTSGCLDPANSSSCTPDMIQTMPRISCPPHPNMPRINFDFTFTPKFLCLAGETPARNDCIRNSASVPQPRMIIHQCYRAELNGAAATNCDRVRRYSINQCQRAVRQTINSGGRAAVNADASELDDHLQNIIDPFPSSSSSSSSSPASTNTTSLCLANAASPIDNSAADVSHCAAVSESANGTIPNCRRECITAVRECRRPGARCWSEAMITAHCEGRRNRTTGTWNNPPSPPGHSNFNRDDSGNLTTSIENTTFIHEVGHIMNLDDEYQDATYPFLPQGEDDSMMNRSTSTSRFYPRQFNKMLEPARCTGTGPFATGTTP